MTKVYDVTNTIISRDSSVNALLDDGPAWNYATGNPKNVIYYTYDHYRSVSSGVHSTVYRFNENQIAATELALSYIESVTAINFVQTDSASLANMFFLQGDIISDNTSGLAEWRASWSYDQHNNVTSFEVEATVYLDVVDFLVINDNPTKGSVGYGVILHELGHVLGLKHPFEGDYRLSSSTDNTDHTVMSYTDTGEVKSTFQVLDLMALDWLYGRDGLGGAYGINSTEGPLLPVDATKTTSTELTVIVNSGVLGNAPIVLYDVQEIVTSIYGQSSSHTISAIGQVFELSEVESLFMTVTKNGEFSSEFQSEIATAYPEYFDITYSEAITLVGTVAIDSVILNVAGSDGNYIG